MHQDRQGKTTWIWQAKKEEIIAELERLQLPFHPTEPLPDLRAKLRAFVKKTSMDSDTAVPRRTRSQTRENETEPDRPDDVASETTESDTDPDDQSETIDPADQTIVDIHPDPRDSPEPDITTDREKMNEAAWEVKLRKKLEAERAEMKRKMEISVRNEMEKFFTAQAETEKKHAEEKSRLERENARIIDDQIRTIEKLTRELARRNPSQSPPVATPNPAESQGQPTVHTSEEDDSREAREMLENILKELGKGHLTRTNTSVQEQVRKWGVTFNGGRDLRSFLERIDELSISYQIPHDKLLDCIPILLRDKALLWHRNNRQHWTSWEDFVRDLKSFYLPIDVDRQLEDEIRNRTQGPKESAREYITNLQTMVRRHGDISETAELDRLYTNLRSEYKLYIRRHEIKNVTELIKYANEFERIQAESYRPPPAGHQSSMPETAYEAPKKKRTADINAVDDHYDPRTHCWRCGQRGHIRPNCRNGFSKFCSRCGRKGIFSRDCTCPKPGNGSGAGRMEPNRPSPGLSRYRDDRQKPNTETDKAQSYLSYQGYNHLDHPNNQNPNDPTTPHRTPAIANSGSTTSADYQTTAPASSSR